MTLSESVRSSIRLFVNPLAIVLSALLLRLINLDGPALWYDESGSAWMASLPFARMIAATAGDTHPPLYLALLWFWVRAFGVDEFSLRLPSVIFGVLAVVMVVAIGERLKLWRGATLLAAAIMAVLPAQLHYGQEARMYALFQFEFLSGVWAALGRRWWVMCAALAAMLWTHHYGLLYFPVVALIGLWQVSRQCLERNVAVIVSWPLRHWAWACIVAAGSWLPWLTVLAAQMRAVGDGYWLQPVTLGAALYPFYVLAWGFSGTETTQLHTALIMFGLISFAIVKATRERHGRAMMLAAAALAPWALAIIISLVWKPMLLFRGLLPSTGLLSLLVAWALTYDTSRFARWAMIFISVPMLVASLVSYYVHIDDQKGGALPVIAIIEWQPGDVVYHVNDGSLMSFHWYTPREWPQYAMPGDWHNLGALSDETRSAMKFNIMPLSDVPSWHRAWVIYSASPTTALAEDIAVTRLLTRYPHVTAMDAVTDVTHQAVYLLWNDKVP